MKISINIAKKSKAYPKGEHFFRIEIPNNPAAAHYENVFSEIAARFPESEGFKISVSKWEESGSDITTELAAKLIPNKALDDLNKAIAD